MQLFTIGFTQKKAEQFFACLRRPGLTRVIDVRLHNVSQLAGFSKRDDLAFFLRAILALDYMHMPMLAPTREILHAYRKGFDDWAAYERKFLALMQARRIANRLDQKMLNGACLLCSEPAADYCHRRLVAEHLQAHWGNVEILHL